MAVVFNEETRRPTYRLAYGVVGASNALKLAREMGLAPEILEMAEGYLNQDELRAYRLLASVEAAQQDLARQEMELKRREAELDRHDTSWRRNAPSWKPSAPGWSTKPRAPPWPASRRPRPSSRPSSGG